MKMFRSCLTAAHLKRFLFMSLYFSVLTAKAQDVMVINAVGSNRTLNFSSPYNLSSCYVANSAWQIQNKPIFNMITANGLRVNGTGGPLDEADQYQLNASIEPYAERITGTLILSNLTSQQKLLNIRFVIVCDGCFVYVYNKTLQVQYCANSTNNMLQVNFTGNAKYNRNGSFYCAHPGVLFFHSNSTPVEKSVYPTKCQSSAEWENQHNFECWSEPNVKLETNRTITSKKLQVISGEYISFSCIVDEVFPPANSSLWFNGSFLKDINTSATLLVNHTYHDKTIYCNSSNNYTKRFGYANISNDVKFDVLFYPVIQPNSCFFSSNDTLRANINFLANPPVNDTDVYLQVKYSNGSQGQVYGNLSNSVIAHNFSVVKKVGDRVSSVQFAASYAINGTFRNTTLNISKECSPVTTTSPSTPTSISPTADNGITTEPTVDETSGTTITNGHTTQTTTKNNSVIIAAAAGGGGALLLIAVIILTCCIMKKRKKTEFSDAIIQNQAFSESSLSKDEKLDRVNPIYDTSGGLTNGGKVEEDKKEEVINPLYGTTPAPNDTYASVDKKKNKKKAEKQKPGKSEKEEKQNPLYEGASTSGLQVEEAYAEVDRKHLKNKKDKKKPGAAGKGEVNGGFSQEPTAESMYAVVDKKKTGKGKKSRDEPSTSSGVTQDCTYAEVQKSNKKKKDGKKSDNEPSTSAGATQDCTYAEVQKKDKKKKKDGNDGEDLHGSSKD